MECKTCNDTRQIEADMVIWLRPERVHEILGIVNPDMKSMVPCPDCLD